MVEQEEPVRRRVALKVIRLGMDTKSVIARFEAERQALALMDHPNIAKVFDGGATESDRPYFVMELVRGSKITEYCDQAHLSTGERLQLFIQVSQAVQHAHQEGIIHRASNRGTSLAHGGGSRAPLLSTPDGGSVLAGGYIFGINATALHPLADRGAARFGVPTESARLEVSTTILKHSSATFAWL